MLAAMLGFVACSGGGGSSPTATPSTGPSQAAISVALGNEEALGSGYSYEVLVTLTNAAGQVITGPYPSAVTLTTSDTTDTGFSATASGENIASSVSITSSTQPVFFVYDGAKLSSAVSISAASSSAPSAQYTFTATGVSGGTTTSTTSTTVASLSIAPNGALPQSGTAGSFTLTVAGYSSTGALVTGTYANPIVLTSNDTADLTFSVNGGAASTTATVSASGAIVVVNYDGATVPGSTTINASASGVPTVSIPFAPTSPTATAATSISSISLAQIGAAPNEGTAGQFALTITASANGSPISGQYPTGIVVSSNDSTVLGLSTSSGGPFTPSVTVNNSSTLVYVQYSGATVPQSTEFAANAGSVQGVLPFNPESTQTQATRIQTLYISTSGAPPTTDSYGSQPIYIEAFDQNGNVINGTYPSAVDLTINNATELDLSLGAYTPATDCSPAANINPCPNVAAVVVNGSGQVTFGDYAPLYSTYPSQVSVSTTGIECAAINFPLATTASTSQSASPAPASTGSTPFTCQLNNPAPTPSPDASATSSAVHRKAHWKLVPAAARH